VRFLHDLQFGQPIQCINDGIIQIN